MANALTRARNILNALPLTEEQRELYSRGMAAMDEAALERTTSKLEATLARAPETLAAARELLANQLAQSRPRKRAVILVEDEDYRKALAGMLGENLEIETPAVTEEAVLNVGTTLPDVVICDFHMPDVKGMDIVRLLRRVTAAQCPVFVLTSNPEEDGQVAAAGATGYRTSTAVADLSRAVTSAIEAAALLSLKI
jgi:CheY-like chemotaxis protein